MAFDRTVHHTIKTREGSEPGRTTPYIQLHSAEGLVIIQNGQFLNDTGEVLEGDDIPDWARESAAALSAEACESVGIPFTGKAKSTKAKAAPVDIHAAEKGNPPMQLNAGEGGEAEDKAEKVPQGQGDPNAEADAARKAAEPANQPPKPGVRTSKVDPSLRK